VWQEYSVRPDNNSIFNLLSKTFRRGEIYNSEIKGESRIKSARSVSENAFVYSLGQIVTRMKVVDARHAYNYGLGLPESSANIAIRRIPWQFARKVCLYVFSVNSTGKVKLYSWQDLKKIQKEK
jgi:hypothetical protein